MCSLRVIRLPIHILSVVTVFVLVATSCGGSSTFSYVVHVQDSASGKNVSNANVTIDVVGEAPLKGVTDSEGIARITVDIRHENQAAQLHIDADGYDEYSQNIRFIQDELPPVIRIQPKATLQETAIIPSSASTSLPAQAAGSNETSPAVADTPALAPSPASTAVAIATEQVTPSSLPSIVPSGKPEFTITSPKNGDDVDNVIDIQGTFTNAPPNVEIWLYVYATDIKKYYFSQVDLLDNSQWKAKAVTIGDPNEHGTRFKVGIIALNLQDSNALRQSPDRLDSIPSAAEILTKEIILYRK